MTVWTGLESHGPAQEAQPCQLAPAMLQRPPDAAQQPQPACQLPALVLHHVFDHLAPRDLCRASAVCRLWRDLNRDAAADRAWQGFYGELWPAPDACPAPRWQAAFGAKMQQARSWRGRAKQDRLFGHVANVRCLALHAPGGLLFTGGVGPSAGWGRGGRWGVDEGTASVEFFYPAVRKAAGIALPGANIAACHNLHLPW